MRGKDHWHEVDSDGNKVSLALMPGEPSPVPSKKPETE
jgi:hypothetical protein